MKKEHVKEILDFGFKLELPYKHKINSWYTNISITKTNNHYIIHPQSIKFYDIDEAVNYFLNEAITSKNKGYIQNRLSVKIDFEEEYDLEKPNKELKKLFKDEGELVDEEAKEFNIIVKEFPKVKDAVEDFENIINNFDTVVQNSSDLFIKYIIESLSSYDKKYSMLDTYITMSFVFKPDGTKKEYKNEYRSSFDFEDFTLARLEVAKSNNGNGYKYKNIEITLKLRGDEDYYRYELSV